MFASEGSLVKVAWREGKALGSEEGEVMGSALSRVLLRHEQLRVRAAREAQNSL
jgi:hypothetical protein